MISNFQALPNPCVCHHHLSLWPTAWRRRDKSFLSFDANRLYPSPGKGTCKTGLHKPGQPCYPFVSQNMADGACWCCNDKQHFCPPGVAVSFVISNARSPGICRPLLQSVMMATLGSLVLVVIALGWVLRR